MRGSTRTRLAAACAGSLALHALVIALVAGLPVRPNEPAPHERPAVVWVADLRTIVSPLERETEPEPPSEAEPEPSPEAEPEPALEAESEAAVEAEPDATAEAEPEPAAEPEPQPAAEAEPAPPAEAEPATETEPDAEAERLVEAERAPPPRESPPEPDADAPARSFVIREADLEEAWRRARQQASEELEQGDGYLTFSLDDLVEPEPPGEPGSGESIFEEAERYRGNDQPSLLSPGRARTRFGRRIAELCNALTGGGIGLMGFASLCADRPEAATLFRDLKPAYLRSRPVCEEVDVAAATAEGEGTTIKCRLVEQE